MFVTKKDGSKQTLSLNKIQKRIKEQSKGLKVNSDEIAIQTVQGLYDGVSTKELDTLSARIAAGSSTIHPDYNILASNLTVSRLQKEVGVSISDYFDRCNSLLHDTVKEKYLLWKDVVEETIDFSRDYHFDYFGINTMMKLYLLRDSNGILELPQHTYLRVSLYLSNTVEDFVNTYNQVSNQKISLATPILINGGTTNSSLISCSIHYNKADDLSGILDTFKEISQHSADSSGIGLCVDNLRSSNSALRNGAGKAHGIVPYAKVVQDLMIAYNQASKRAGSCALYMSVWHDDIFNFLNLKKQTGDEKLRARDLFLAVNIPNNFMEAVKADSDYYLFCPNILLKHELDFNNKWGVDFENEYNKAVSLGIGRAVKAREILRNIEEVQIESGLPYIHFIDHTNNKSNHNHYGKIKSSQLCIEITLYTDPNTTAQCCLGAIPVHNHVKDNAIDWDSLKESVKILTFNLNEIINKNKYSTKASEKGGKEQRSIAIGILGLADLFFKLDLSFTSEEAKSLNKEVMQFIYKSALESSIEYKKQTGLSYVGLKESNYGNGNISPDWWGIDNTEFDQVKKDLITFGLANSTVTALMPTATTANVIGCYESFEPIHSNIFIRNTNSGEFVMFNNYLIKDLDKLGLWCEEVRNEIILNKGSIQTIDFMKYNKKILTSGGEMLLNINLQHLKEKYKTVWEIKQRDLIDMAADRAPYVDMTQSMNLYVSSPNYSILSSMYMYCWEKKLKTGVYYLRSEGKLDTNKAFALNTTKIQPNDVDDTCIGCAV